MKNLAKNEAYFEGHTENPPFPILPQLVAKIVSGSIDSPRKR
tara:strand:- start:2540 stop:2665 length:126 start_codon:yes stop_codon:yes gene_type:complete